MTEKIMKWTELLSPSRFGDKVEATLANSSRSRFEQDYDRLVFSHPFRKLQDKTQVFPLPEDDFVHTRLTHSLEVSSVGRSLGKAVGDRLLEKDKGLKEAGYSSHDFGAIVAAASLAHDLGNPPFGHAGEDAISSFFTDTSAGASFQGEVSAQEWSDLLSFEGNAQGFRILNDSAHGGLRLTYAALGAFTKYPKSSHAPLNKGRKSQKKYGFYRSELGLFHSLAAAMGLRPLDDEAWCRHPLAFLVEAADDICYNIIDLEDGCRLGLVPFEEVRDLLGGIIGERYDPQKLEKYPDSNEKLGLLRAMAITRLIDECVGEFVSNEEAILAGEYDRALTENIPSSGVMAKISKLSVAKIYRSDQVLEREAGGFEVIGKLMEAFCMAGFSKYHRKEAFTARKRSIFRLLPEVIQSKMAAADTVYELLMVNMDFISSLTDSHAIKLYRTIYGYSLPVGK